jgi:hypothetical protein
MLLHYLSVNITKSVQGTTPHRLNGAKTAFSHVVQTHDYLDNNWQITTYTTWVDHFMYTFVYTFQVFVIYTWFAMEYLTPFNFWCSTLNEFLLHPIAEIIILHQEFTSNHRFLIILYNFASCILIGRFVILIPEKSYIKINEITVIFITLRNCRFQFS